MIVTEKRFCEYCGKEIDEEHPYGKGRFCNKSCQLAKTAKKASLAAAVKAHEKSQAKFHDVVCPACGKTFRTISGKFCSRDCSIHYSGNKSRQLSDESRKKQSESLKKFFESHPEAKERSALAMTKVNERRYDKHYEYQPKVMIKCSVCGKDIKKTKSGMCQDCLRHSEAGLEYLSQKGKKGHEQVVAEGRFKGWMTRNITSYAEKFWIDVLNNNSVPYEREYIVQYGEKANDHYFLDFFIEINGKRVDLEIDGKQHKYADRMEHDKIRDERLRNLGYEVYRVEWNSVNNERGKAAMKQKIDAFLQFIH
jgi:very-short-patch-repair endonuclease/rRNA maturation endonuclease Nob1